MKKSLFLALLIAMLLVSLLVFSGCNKNKPIETTTPAATTTATAVTTEAPKEHLSLDGFVITKTG